MCCVVMLQKFCFGGRLALGPDVRSIFLTLSLILTPVTLFCVFVCQSLKKEFNHDFGNLIVIICILLCLYVSCSSSFLPCFSNCSPFEMPWVNLMEVKRYGTKNHAVQFTEFWNVSFTFPMTLQDLVSQFGSWEPKYWQYNVSLVTSEVDIWTVFEFGLRLKQTSLIM